MDIGKKNRLIKVLEVAGYIKCGIEEEDTYWEKDSGAWPYPSSIRVFPSMLQPHVIEIIGVGNWTGGELTRLGALIQLVSHDEARAVNNVLEYATRP